MNLLFKTPHTSGSPCKKGAKKATYAVCNCKLTFKKKKKNPEKHFFRKTVWKQDNLLKGKVLKSLKRLLRAYFPVCIVKRKITWWNYVMNPAIVVIKHPLSGTNPYFCFFILQWMSQFSSTGSKSKQLICFRDHLHITSSILAIALLQKKKLEEKRVLFIPPPSWGYFVIFWQN